MRLPSDVSRTILTCFDATAHHTLRGMRPSRVCAMRSGTLHGLSLAAVCILFSPPSHCADRRCGVGSTWAPPIAPPPRLAPRVRVPRRGPHTPSQIIAISSGSSTVGQQQRFVCVRYQHHTPSAGIMAASRASAGHQACMCPSPPITPPSPGGSSQLHRLLCQQLAAMVWLSIAC